jgi:hypothetical protein
MRHGGARMGGDSMGAAEEISFCLTAADEIKAQIEKLRTQEDYFRWRAAELIAAELDAGKSQRALAGEIGRSQSLVSFMAAVWRRFGVITPEYTGNQRPYFQDAYRHVQKGRPEWLDGAVPKRDDDDDMREFKTCFIVFNADPAYLDGWFENIAKPWAEHFSTKCRQCGSDHRAEAKKYIRDALRAGMEFYGPDRELASEEETARLLIRMRPIFSNKLKSYPCKREPITQEAA